MRNTGLGQCARCGLMFAIDSGGNFKRKHGSRIARCPGSRDLAVGFGKPKSFVKSPFISHSLGKA